MNELDQPNTVVQTDKLPLPGTPQEAVAYLQTLYEQCTELSDYFNTVDSSYILINRDRLMEIKNIDQFQSPMHAAHCLSVLLADRIGNLAGSIQSALEILSNNDPQSLGADYNSFLDVLSSVGEEKLAAHFQAINQKKRYVPEESESVSSWPEMLSAMKAKLDTALEYGEVTEENAEILRDRMNAIGEKLTLVPLLEPVLTGQPAPEPTERIYPTCITKTS